MTVTLDDLPSAQSLVRVGTGDGTRICLWRDGRLLRPDRVELTFDYLLELSAADMKEVLETLDVTDVTSRADMLMAPVESQEVWAAGVTYLRSRDARIAESDIGDVYDRIYMADRPELFLKAAGWRVVGPNDRIGVRSDSNWNVPEPELAVLANAAGEIVAYAIGNDVSSRQIEGANPLYLPQAKVYDRSCALGPAAVMVWGAVPGAIRMTITRGGFPVYTGETHVENMTRSPADLVRWLLSHYTLPHGVWLFTGTGLVPNDDFTLTEGDDVVIEIDGLGRLHNVVGTVAAAHPQPKLVEPGRRVQG